MTIAAGAVVPLDEKRRRRHDLLAQLREVDHWRRLVAARLDLAVAAVTSIDEPDGARCDLPSAGSLPAGLREILGLPACHQALPEASVLLRLRAAQRDLDEYARVLRESTDLATLELASAMDAERVAQRQALGRRYSRQPTEPQLRAEPHLHVVSDRSTGHPGDGPADPATARPTPIPTAHSTDQTP